MRGSSLALVAVLGAGCTNPEVLYVGSAVPATWQEHWFEHTQLLDLVASDDAVAIYFDKDVDRAQMAWVFPFLSRTWKYTLGVYGQMGPGRLYAIFHTGRYPGCHAANHFSASHDNRIVFDCGFPASYTVEQIGFQATHMVANLVEATSNGKNGSPAMKLWGDSKWAEFYQYDLYGALGDQAEVDLLHRLWTADDWMDSFPVPGTHWFRDFFYPLWRDRGGAPLMARFFAALAQHFPSAGSTYTRDMNWGEFVHFMSGAARQDLKPAAATAFGWPSEWEEQYQDARLTFSQISY